jgi:GntR family transcriptional regulator/MocR family aminotransferase
LVIGYGSTPAEQLAPAVGVLAGLAAKMDGKPKRLSSEASSAKLRV